MKIQTLGIIFIIIILPISFALSLYTKSQIETLTLQSLYDAKLQQSTHDALQAFQINTENNTESNLADSKIKDIEASIKTFFNSLEGNFELRGYSLNELKEYVPAIVYTMYDGYYIYSPYSNVATTTETGVVVNESESENVQYGLKPYIYYSCRYKRAGDDFVITYSLDNYITIKGIIGGKYINDSGYIISNIEPYGDGTYKYNGIVIEAEQALEEYIGNTKYKYVKISGTKYYWDEAKNRIFYILNGNMHTQVSINNNVELYNKYVSLITNNSSALRYYKEAYEFTNRVLNEYKLKNLKTTDAYDADGNRIEFATNANKNIFIQDETKDKTPVEYSTSNFNQHRKAVIRYTIESNLSVAIANFNRYTKNTSYNYQMPVLKETDWDMLASNVSIISFLQGLNLGGKIYNGYSVVLNTETEELVREQDIYIVGRDEHYHRAEDKYLLEYKTLGDYVDKASYSRGVLDLDFKMTSANGSGDNKVYYYPRRELSCYECVVNHTGVNYDFEYDSIYEYLNKISVNTQTTLLRKTYYTALGRERWGNKVKTVHIEDIDEINVNKDFETNEITIDFDPKTYTNQTVKASIKFADSINLDKVVIAISSPPALNTVEYQTLVRFENGDFTNITSNTMEYTITDNSIVYVVAYSKSGKKIIKYDVVDWIDPNPPVINSITFEEIMDNSTVAKKYNSIQEWNNRGYEWTRNSVKLTINATDAESGIDRIEYTYNNGATVQSIPKANGGMWAIHTTFNQNIRIRAVDVAGNFGEWTEQFTIKIDKDPPTIQTITLRYEDGTIYQSGTLTNRNIIIEPTGRDAHSGIDRYEFSNDRKTTKGTFETTLKISSTVNQSYYIRAIDKVGNVGEWSTAYVINIDNTPPTKATVTLKYNNQNGEIYQSGTLTNQNVWKQAHAEDSNGIARYEYSYNGKDVIGVFNNPWTITSSIYQTYYVRAVDRAGNSGPWSDPYVINIDKDPPIYTGNLTGWVENRNQVRLKINLPNPTDISQIEIRYKKKNEGNGYKNIKETTGIKEEYEKVIRELEYGTTYEIYMILYDGAGNTTQTNSIEVTTQIKSPNQLTGSQQNTNQIKLTLQIDEVEKIQRVEVRYKKVNDGQYTTVTGNKVAGFTHILTGLSYSTKYDIYVILYDYFGRKEETNHIQVNTGINASNLTGSVINKNQIKVNLTIGEINKITKVEVRYKKANDGQYTAVTGNKATNFTHTIVNLEGNTTYKVQIKLYDEVGNELTTNEITLTTEVIHTHTESCYHKHTDNCYRVCGGQLFTPYGTHLWHECRVCHSSDQNSVSGWENEDATPGEDCHSHYNGNCRAKVLNCSNEGQLECGF